MAADAGSPSAARSGNPALGHCLVVVCRARGLLSVYRFLPGVARTCSRNTRRYRCSGTGAVVLLRTGAGLLSVCAGVSGKLAADTCSATAAKTTADHRISRYPVMSFSVYGGIQAAIVKKPGHASLRSVARICTRSFRTFAVNRRFSSSVQKMVWQRERGQPSKSCPDWAALD